MGTDVKNEGVNEKEMEKDFTRFGDLLELGRERKWREVSIRGIKILHIKIKLLKEVGKSL